MSVSRKLNEKISDSTFKMAREYMEKLVKTGAITGKSSSEKISSTPGAVEAAAELAGIIDIAYEVRINGNPLLANNNALTSKLEFCVQYILDLDRSLSGPESYAAQVVGMYLAHLIVENDLNEEQVEAAKRVVTKLYDYSIQESTEYPPLRNFMVFGTQLRAARMLDTALEDGMSVDDVIKKVHEGAGSLVDNPSVAAGIKCSDDYMRSATTPVYKVGESVKLVKFNGSISGAGGLELSESAYNQVGKVERVIAPGEEISEGLGIVANCYLYVVSFDGPIAFRGDGSSASKGGFSAVDLARA